MSSPGKPYSDKSSLNSISTNGSLPNRIENFTKEVTNFKNDIELTVQISIDDFPKKHNKVRKIENLFENCIVKRAVSITKEQAESSGLDKSKRSEYEDLIASKLGIPSSEIYVDIPKFSVLPGLKAKILKNNGEIDLARNLSRLVSGLYEAQFDHWNF